MEFIQFNGYLLPEKFQIVKHYLIPTIRKNWQITEEQVTITDDAISYIVKTWGRWEAGVREVKRQVESALRKALCFQEKRVTAKFIQRHFPPPVPLVEWKNEYAQRVGYIPVVGVNRSGEGVVFWVEIHKIDQATNNNSPWNIEIVGNADDSMRESIKSSFLWCRHHIPTFDNANTKWIVYLPSVSLPRGGPSASLAITVGLICTHLNRPIGRLVAMTGEISASGEILPVGGLPAKIVAAENAGLEEILIPAANKDEVDYWLKKSKLSHRIRITPVETIEEVLARLDIKLEKHAS
jgi:ATP-dependent Lon protease